LVLRLDANHYVKWSNTVDAPVSYVMRRAEMQRYLVEDDGLDADEASSMLSTVDEFGSSDPSMSMESVIAGNRAGPDESALSVGEILTTYRNA
jgi:hypothetical protein